MDDSTAREGSTGVAWPSGEPLLWRDAARWKEELLRQWKLGYSLSDQQRAWFGTKLAEKGILELRRHSSLRTLQAEVPPTQLQRRLLDTEFFAHRPEVTFRVYGSGFDLSFLQEMPNVRRFSIDCSSASNVGAVASLPHLEHLGIGLLDLENFDFLNDLVASLTHLHLGWTRSKKPSIAKIERFAHLRSLHVEGHTNGIDAISKLARLENLTLTSVSTPTLDYLRGLSSLRSVEVTLGGIKDVSALGELASVKQLELVQVRGLSDLAFISEMLGLQFLVLQNLPKVTQLPNLTQLLSLRRVHLDNLRGLPSVSPLEKAPVLAQVLVPMSWGLIPVDFAGLLKSSSLTHLSVGFRSDRNRRLLDAMVTSAGKQSGWPGEFVYR